MRDVSIRFTSVTSVASCSSSKLFKGLLLTAEDLSNLLHSLR